MKISRRLAITLVAIGVVGLLSIALVATLTGRQLRPFRADLPVQTKQFTGALITLAPGYHYRLAVGGDGSVPHADCLLGAGANASAECDGQTSALEVSWSLRDDRGQIVASGISPDEQSSFSYGEHVEVDLGYFSVFRLTNAHLTFQYRLNPAPLSSLHPYVLVDAPEALVWYGTSETLASVLFATAGCLGVGKLLLTSWRRRERPAGEE